MRRLLLAATLSLSATPSAFACLNDVTLKGSEREFRSQYQTMPLAPPTALDTSAFDREVLCRGLAGGVLVVAAIALTLRRSPAA